MTPNEIQELCRKHQARGGRFIFHSRTEYAQGEVVWPHATSVGVADIGFPFIVLREATEAEYRQHRPPELGCVELTGVMYYYEAQPAD